MSEANIQSSRKQLRVSRQIWPLAKTYYARARQAKKEGKPVAWTFGFGPPEILHALGVVPVMPEHYVSVLSAKQKVVDYLQQMDERGYPRNACAYQRAVLGFSLSGDELLVPEPDFILAIPLCDGATKAIVPLIEHLKVPYYLLDAPIFFGRADADRQNIDEDVVEYFRLQLEEVIAFVEKVTGQPRDPVRFRRTFELAQRCYELWGELNALRRAVPCPMGVVDEAGDVYPMMQMPGLPEAVGMYEMLLAEVRERVERGEGVIDNERHRLLWLGPAPNYDTSLLNYFEDFGAVLVRSDLDSIYLGNFNPDDPLDGLARKMVANTFSGSLESRIAYTLNLARDYRVDGVVAYTHLGCRLYAGGQRAVCDALKEEFGIPYLLLGGDLVDARGYDRSSLRNKIEEFLETLG